MCTRKSKSKVKVKSDWKESVHLEAWPSGEQADTSYCAMGRTRMAVSNALEGELAQLVIRQPIQVRLNKSFKLSDEHENS